MLTRAERQAGRAFRDRCAAELAETFTTDPPTYTIAPVAPPVLRHSCPARGGRSTAMPISEVYLPSPDDDTHNVPAGLFAFIYRQGACRLCGQTARSDRHRVVLAAQRPPLDTRR